MVGDIITLYNEHSGRIVAALLDAEGRFNPETFISLDDTVLKQIELIPLVSEEDVLAAPDAEERRRRAALREAQGLLHRLRTRDMCETSRKHAHARGGQLRSPVWLSPLRQRPMHPR